MMFTLFCLLSCTTPPETTDFDLRQRVQIVRSKPPDTLLHRRYPAVLKAKQDVQIVAQLGGTIETKNVVVGQQVKKEDALLQLNNQEAKANVSLAKAKFIEAIALKKQAARQQKRAISLGKQLANAEQENALTQLQRAKAGLLAAEAQLQLAKINLQKMTLTAPFDGEIAAITGEIGGTIPPGQPVIRLVNTTTYSTTIGLVQEEVQSAKSPASRFTIEVSGQHFPATLQHIAAASSTALSWPAKLQVAAQPQLRAGLSITVHAYFPAPQASAIVPLSALADEKHIWTLDNKNHLKKQPVDIVAEHQNMLYVNGLLPDVPIAKHASSTLQADKVILPIEVKP